MPEEITPAHKPCPICQHEHQTIHASLLIIYCHGCHIRFDFKSLASSLGSMLASWDKFPRHATQEAKSCPN